MVVVNTNRQTLLREKTMKEGFSPISIEDYLDRHMQSTPNQNREEMRASIEEMIQFHKEGGRCSCGREIWVVGSATAGWPGCFSHITGEAYPNDDYEIQF